jgi:hypothetical protein
MFLSFSNLCLKFILCFKDFNLVQSIIMITDYFSNFIIVNYIKVPLITNSIELFINVITLILYFLNLVTNLNLLFLYDFSLIIFLNYHFNQFVIIYLHVNLIIIKFKFLINFLSHLSITFD